MSTAGVAVLAKRGRFLVAEPAFERRAAAGSRSTARGANGARAGRPGAARLSASAARAWCAGSGRPDVARDVIEALMLDRGLRRTFPRAVEGEAAEYAAEPPWDGPRRDLTDLPTFTIDPATARDFDDAVSARREGDRVRVWVHIADVGAYVRPDSRHRARDLPARHERLRPRRGRADAARGAVQRGVLAQAGRAAQRGDGGDGDGGRRHRCPSPSTARSSAATSAGPTTRSTSSSRAPPRRRGAVGRAARRRARGGRRAAGQARRPRRPGRRVVRAAVRVRRRRPRGRRCGARCRPSRTG